MHDVRMIGKFLEKHNLAKRSLGIDFVSECIEDFLQSDNLTRLLVNGLPNNPIGLEIEQD